ncbi:DUF6891 domain-containing protein, partial [Actinomadura chokoriensis]
DGVGCGDQPVYQGLLYVRRNSINSRSCCDQPTRPRMKKGQSCGVTEIAGQIPEGSVMDGYVFFHEQDTESVLFDDELLLSYGTFGSESETQKVVEVGERVVAALQAEGLRTEWEGSPAERITVFMEWRNRLVA